jgi:hypothetical protein
MVVRAAAALGFAVPRGAAPRLDAGFTDRFPAAGSFLTESNAARLAVPAFFPAAALLVCTGTITPFARKCPSIGAL